MRKIFLSLLALLMIGCTDKQVMAGYDIVPLPQSVKTKSRSSFYNH